MKGYCLCAMRSQPKVLMKIKNVVPRGGGMLPSEMLLFASVCISQDVTHIVESGRKLGFSTEVLSECECFNIFSIDNNPVQEVDAALKSRYPQLLLGRGDGEKMVSKVISSWKGNRIAVLLDGPKNLTGCKILNEIKQDIVLSGIHDVCKGDQRGGLNPGRVTLETKYDSFFSDDADLLKEFGEIDAEFLCPSYSSHSELLSDSCVLGIVKGGHWI